MPLSKILEGNAALEMYPKNRNIDFTPEIKKNQKSLNLFLFVLQPTRILTMINWIDLHRWSLQYWYSDPSPTIVVWINYKWTFFSQLTLTFEWEIEMKLLKNFYLNVFYMYYYIKTYWIIISMVVSIDVIHILTGH